MPALELLAQEFLPADLGLTADALTNLLTSSLADAQTARPDAPESQITAEVRATLLRLQIRHVTRQLSRKRLGDVETQRDLKVQLAQLRDELRAAEGASGLVIVLPRAPAHTTGRRVEVS